MVAVAPTMEEAEADLEAVAAVKGWNDAVVAMARQLLVFGDPDTVGEQIAEAMRFGIDGVALNLPASGHDPERIGLLGEIAQKVIAASGRN
jgi:alkanesulfonate monooxygenase SsuD/methylene tetrahydromethanopterin reductase-like flavin-dependent oxidoreductase (luciferase family)